MREKSVIRACVAAGLMVGMVACDGAVEPGTGTDAMVNPDGGGTNPDGGGTNPDGGGTDPDGGMPGSSCASHAAEFCPHYEACNPNGFIGAFENQDICREIVAAACNDTSLLPDATGPVDRDACLAATISADCNPLSSVSAACRPAPGLRGRDANCGDSTQCGLDSSGTRLYCRNATNPACEDGQCFPANTGTGTMTCSTSGGVDLCDVFNGIECVRRFNRDMGGTEGTGPGNRCLEIVYGGASDDCFPGSERRCASGFTCNTDLMRCVSVLGANEPCDAMSYRCDTRLGLTCRPSDPTDPASTPTCQAAVRFVRVGAQCNTTIDGVFQTCSAYALCSSDATPVCQLRRRRGETCTASPDNCWGGLECRAGTCQDREAPTCP